MRFASLGSGSKGNATLVASDTACVMIDCGFNTQETEKRLLQLDRTPRSLDAILVTHEHHDHLSGVGPFARKHQIPVYMTRGTYLAYQSRSKSKKKPDITLFNCHQSFMIKDLMIQPFPVPHDAMETSQFVISDGQRKFAIATDCGHVTAHMTAMLTECDALLVEFNHDIDMLQNGPYPPSLKARVSGDYGHLNNDQAVALLKHVDDNRPTSRPLQHVVAMHISEKNNCVNKVERLIKETLTGASDNVLLARQDTWFDWREIA